MRSSALPAKTKGDDPENQRKPADKQIADLLQQTEILCPEVVSVQTTFNAQLCYTAVQNFFYLILHQIPRYWIVSK